MLTRIIALARRISPGMNQTLVRLWYHYLAVADKEAHLLFMNYGYADLQPDAEALALSEVDERGSSSMCWRLYSAIIHGNWHLFIKRLQEYWRSRCKNSRRREEQERLRHLRHVSSMGQHGCHCTWPFLSMKLDEEPHDKPVGSVAMQQTVQEWYAV